MGTKAAIVLVVIAVCIGRWVSNLSAFISLPPDYTTNDQGCHVVGQGRGMVGSEDLALGRHSILFITSGDLHTAFNQGAHSARPGGIWILDMRVEGAAQPVKLLLDEFPSRLFQPHGLDVSNSTNRLYTISHNGDYSSVDIFSLHYRTECLSLPWSCIPVTLTYTHSITSSHFPNNGINDVVEASSNEVYVTQWQPFPMPRRGKKNKETVLQELQGIAAPFIWFMGIRLTSVFHCRWSEGGENKCTMATTDRFILANGITASADGSTVFVNDVLDRLITIMKRNKVTGKLSRTGSIPLPYPVDNIEFDDNSGEIIMGTVPSLKSAIENERSVSNVAVPGGLAVARQSSAGVWEVESVLEHDGTKLSQVSAAARLGPVTVLGSPFSKGVLVCKTE